MSQQSFPHLIIAGVNRAATTSLYTYLSRHPEVCASSIKETNYFMPVVFGDRPKPIGAYAAYFQNCTQRRYRMEASPRYIFGGAKLAETIREYLGSVMIIFVLRPPIDRLVSYFKQMKRSQELPSDMSCDEYVRRALEELPAAKERANGNPLSVYRESIFLRGLAQGFYVDYLKEWYSVFPDSIRVYFFESLTRTPASVMGDLSKWLDIDASVYQDAEFPWENRAMTHKNQTLFAMAAFINFKLEAFWRRHEGIKRFTRDIYCRLNEKRSENEQLLPERRGDLEVVYGPYNRRLVRMLSRKGYRNLPDWLSRYRA